MTALDHDTEVLGHRPAIAGCPELIAPGTVVGAWRIGTLIAAGGCGAVYAARHVALDRPAAVKVLHGALARAPDIVDRFIREARAVHRIGHPNLVDVFDLGTCRDGRPFFAMELLAAGDLESRLETHGRFGLDEMLAVVRPIGAALTAAHRSGYLHRDVKARNIGFAGDVPKLLDFGVAKLLELGRDAGTCTVRIGTPHCMAPEQILGERVDPRTDVYAIGVLVHQLVTGRVPFDAATPAEIERLHLEAPPPPVSRLAPVPPALDAVVQRALAKRAADRPASIAELVAELAAIVDAVPDPARRDAVAIRVEVAVPEVWDDADVDAAAAVTARAVELLAAGGFAPVIATATSVVAGRIVTGDPREARRAAEALAAALERALPARAGVSAGPATVAPTGRFLAGELFEVPPWIS